MKKKQVLLNNYEGHQYYPDYETPWSDTWVVFKKKKKTIRIGPTIVSLPDHIREEEFDREFNEKHPEYKSSQNPPSQLPDGEWEFYCPHFRNGCWLPHQSNGSIPTIVVNAEGINKKSIEKSIEWFLRTHHGVTSPINFRWKNRRKKFFVNPVPAF